MAMIECPECKKQISDQAPTCINCGVPITQQQQPPPEQYQTHIQQQPILYQPVQHGHVMGEKVKKPIFKKWWFWLIIAIGIIIIIAASSSGGGSTPSAAPMPDPAPAQPAPEEPADEQPADELPLEGTLQDEPPLTAEASILQEWVKCLTKVV